MREFDLPLNDLVSVMRQRAQLHPDRVAIDFLGDGDHITESLTYAGLDQRARALAATLQASSAPGDRALLLFPSGPDYVVAFFACLYAGVIGVPVYPPEAHQPRAFNRLQSIAQDADAALLLTDADGALALARLPSCSSARVLVTSDLRSTASDWREHGVAPRDIAFLQYTSGSTASPKGVMVSHANLVANKLALSHALQETSADRCVSWLPLFHDMGLILGLLQPLFYGLPLALMSPRHFLERPRRWLEALSRYRGSISFGPDFAYRLCADRLRPESLAGVDLSCWRVAGSGAEPIRHTTMRAFVERFARLGFDPRAINPCYGLAEATLFSSGHVAGGLRSTTFDVDALARGQARECEGEGATLVACGTPHASTELRIVEPDTGRRLGEREVGEIWLRGPTNAQGYWRHDAATQATFAARDAQGEGPYLRTGDLGFLHEGQLYISSRLKDLIILRGRNFYPQDIELEIESQVAGVRRSRVAAFAIEHDGVEAIGIAAEAARLRPGEGTPDDVVQRIRAVVAETFNEPVAVVALIGGGSLPKTSSGKLQRSAARKAWLDGSLPMVAVYRSPSGPGEGQSPQAPRSDTEQRLAALWRELLDVRQVGLSDNFIALGGQSMLVTRLAARVRVEFGVNLSVADCFAARDLADLAARIERAPQAAATATRAEKDLDPPLSKAQSRLWFLQALQPGSAYYHVATGIRFTGPVDADRLQLALAAVAQRHESLRTALIDTEAGGPRQRIAPTGESTLERVRLAEEAAFGKMARDFVARPFDLARSPLWRASWVESSAQAPRLLLAMHHAIVDGASLPVLLEDLAQAYRGEPFACAAPRYADLARAQDASLAAELGALTQRARSQLQSAPTLSTLPPDHARPTAQSHRGEVLRIGLPDTLMVRLERWARERQATVFTVLFAAYAATLAEIAGQHDLVIGTDVAHRPQPEGERAVGFFVNQLPVRWQGTHASMTADAALDSARRALLAAYERQDLPFDALVEVLRPPRTLSHAPVFQTKFVYQERPARVALGAGLAMTLFDIDRDTAELDLLFDCVREVCGHGEDADQLSLRIEFATDLYRRDTVQVFADRWLQRLHDWLRPPAPSVKPMLQRRAARGQENAEAQA